MGEFISKHKIPIIICSVILVLVCAVIGIRSMNAKRKAEEQAHVEQVQKAQESDVQADEEVEEEELQNSYQSSLSIKAKEEQKRKQEAEKRLQAKKEAEKKAEEERKAAEHAKKAKPTYGDAVKIWSSDGVPNRMEDGKSIKEFHSRLSLDNVGSKWGSPLTDKDKLTKNFYMVGVDQNKDDYVTGVQLQSFGWYFDNEGSIPADSAIKFSDLNVVGSLASDHVALLCCYDWYSIWGLKDTMMVFEDISGTLKPEDFTPGKIFSAIAYKHNIKVANVDGYRIICVQYDTFK